MVPADGLRLLLTKGKDGDWIPYYGSSDDQVALKDGLMTDNIEYMMRDEVDLTDAYDLVRAPSAKYIQLLVTRPAIIAQAERPRRWESLFCELKGIGHFNDIG
ncbi:hypothetical protein GN244_ATG08272 [Phytophthora infestans]|uniref:Crinkler (CRN) family protein n=1 Tax=Phytophthora infestans TaxID=4787 RepID=A0A833WVT4_PHYIN|nr:hypothetical protein GN244_ATG08272 [Phytophthora infestans]